MPGPRKNLTPLDMKMLGLAYNQGGIINFLGKQPEVTAPIRAQSHADSPPTQLAYITDAEKDLLVNANIHGSMDGKPNPGPAGLESLDDYYTTAGGGIAGGSGEQVYDSGVDNTGSSSNISAGGSGGGGSGNSGGYESSEAYGINPGMAVGEGSSGSGTVYNTTDFVPAPGQADKMGNLLEVLPDKQKELEALALAKTGADEAETLTDTLLGRIKTKIMGGGKDGNLDLTKEEAYEDLPAGMHPLRKQYEYLSKKYGPAWQKTTQAKVLEGYLSGVPVERGGGQGARDDTYGGGEKPQVDQFGNPINPEQFEVAEKFRQQLLNSMGLAGSDIGGMNTMGSVANQLEGLTDTDYNKLRYGLSPEQYFNFNQQLMAADPSAENQAYKDARPFSSGAGLGALAERFMPGATAMSAFAGGLFPERDLSGFENYADYEQAGAGFRPLPVPDQSDSNEPVRRPGFKPQNPNYVDPSPFVPDLSPTYPFPVKPPNGSKFPFPVGITSAFDPRFIGPSFKGSQYTNQGVSPAFYEALRRFS